LSMLPDDRQELAKIGYTMHPFKFQCQKASHGCNFLGRTLKQGRIYPSRRIIRNAMSRTIALNSCINIKHLDYFLSVVNSFFGIFKTCDGYAIARNMIDKIDDKWYRYIDIDLHSLTARAKNGYEKREVICKRLGINYLKIKKYDKRRKSVKTASKAA
jgi:hypothetical protein